MDLADAVVSKVAEVAQAAVVPEAEASKAAAVDPVVVSKVAEPVALAVPVVQVDLAVAAQAEAVVQAAAVSAAADLLVPVLPEWERAVDLVHQVAVAEAHAEINVARSRVDVVQRKSSSQHRWLRTSGQMLRFQKAKSLSSAVRHQQT